MFLNTLRRGFVASPSGKAATASSCHFAPVSLLVGNDEPLIVTANDPASDAAELVANAKKSAQLVPIATIASGGQISAEECRLR
jgi:tripartite-type tricarboxylate transporter receptor subunit TctC